MTKSTGVGRGGRRVGAGMKAKPPAETVSVSLAEYRELRRKASLLDTLMKEVASLQTGVVLQSIADTPTSGVVVKKKQVIKAVLKTPPPEDEDILERKPGGGTTDECGDPIKKDIPVEVPFKAKIAVGRAYKPTPKVAAPALTSSPATTRVVRTPAPLSRLARVGR